MYLNISEVLANDTRLFKHNAEFIPKSNIACSFRVRYMEERSVKGFTREIRKSFTKH